MRTYKGGIIGGYIPDFQEAAKRYMGVFREHGFVPFPQEGVNGVLYVGWDGAATIQHIQEEQRDRLRITFGFVSGSKVLDDLCEVFPGFELETTSKCPVVVRGLFAH